MKHLSKRALAVLLAVLVALSTMVLASVTASAEDDIFKPIDLPPDLDDEDTTETVSETVPVIGDEIFLLGLSDDWTSSEDNRLRLADDGGSTYTAVFELEKGTYEFKIKLGATDIEGGWLGNNGTIKDTTKVTSDMGWKFSGEEDNCKLDASGGKYTFIFNSKENMLVVAYTANADDEPVDGPHPTGIFLLGFDGWTSGDDNEMKNDAKYTGTYRKELQLEKGVYEFKIKRGDTTYSPESGWFGCDTTINDSTTADPNYAWYYFKAEGNNCKLVASGGRYKFVYVPENQSLMIEYKTNDQTESSYIFYYLPDDEFAEGCTYRFNYCSLADEWSTYDFEATSYKLEGKTVYSTSFTTDDNEVKTIQYQVYKDGEWTAQRTLNNVYFDTLSGLLFYGEHGDAGTFVYDVPETETADVSETSTDNNDETETATDASETETVTETATDASETETVTETATDASETETVTESATDASETETVTETASESETVTETQEETETDTAPFVPAKKTTVKLTKTKVKLYLTAVYTIKAKITNASGKTTYKSDDKRIATVTKKGKVKAVKNGTTYITVKNNGVSKKLKVIVKNPSLKKTSASVYKNKTVKIKVNGSGKFVFKSMNSAVATVTSKGVVKGRSRGAAIIKVKANGKILKFKVRVL